MNDEMKKKLDAAAELITDNPLPVRTLMGKVGIPFTHDAMKSLLYRLGAKYPVYEEDDGRIGILRRR